jgi:hypothetical protein
MNTNIKIFLLCPIPDDQKPITEYIGLKKNLLTNWITLSKNNYLKTITNLWFINFVIISLLTINTVLFDSNNLLDWLLTNSFITINILLGIILIGLFRWQQIQKRFNETRLFYEEGSWYDSQVWEKPFLIIKNDKLISTQKIRPIIQRVTKIIILLICLDLGLFSLIQL